jgi:alpha-D-xyloside xylohydrolase
VVADAPLDRIPVWARAGAVIAKIPEDVMTLVPEKESGNTKVKSLDDRRVYEVIGGGEGEIGSGGTRITDFEGRVVVRGAKSLKISGGPAARVTVRWRFGALKSATVNGVEVKVQAGADGPSVEFDYAAESLVEWE